MVAFFSVLVQKIKLKSSQPYIWSQETLIEVLQT